ncbi:hypothetical protein ncot_04845 [Nocardioides sp. JQ2195]|uniref:hypothetical protein n=1 Tax=Nocardioides sp. JQ2195 TaxID=2592334 RepID=UPI00143E93FE|nr:hypothetical protein [Nocardioides sp. JQ2195]QIX26003.1 hypothetical protein ncot_04845 [Nocardioides sp. JQ2195]
MSSDVQVGSPLRRAFAHNDYARERPLYDALAHGFTTVEVDVFLDGGQILVGHGRRDLRPHRTFESMYLQPLADLVEDRGHVWPEHTLTLFVDVKSDARPTYLAVHNALERHRDMLTHYRPDGHLSGPVTVVVSGHTDPVLMESQPIRFATRDGRPGDLVDGLTPCTSAISEKFGRLFDWNGEAELDAPRREGLHRLVSEIHRVGRTARFWGTTPSMWTELVEAGVDQVIADDLPALRDFLLAGP